MVALCLTLLILFVALATDVGFWYGQRRHMQNAADAGALAGAWQLCHGDRSQAVNSALDYAEWNGADRDLVHVDIVDPEGTPNTTSGNTVVVTARTDAQTFFARVIGMDTVRVSAIAASSCGAAVSGCGALPIAFDYPTYKMIPCSEVEEIGGSYKITNYRVGSTFVLWAADNESTRLEAMCDKCSCDALNGYIADHFAHGGSTTVTIVGGQEYSYSDWSALFEGASLILGGAPMSAGSRGWLRLGLQKPYVQPKGTEGDTDCNSLQSCGSALYCWLKYGFSGKVSGETEEGARDGDCLKGIPGVDANALAKAKSFLEGTIHSFVLYDPLRCAPGDPITADCSSGGGSEEKKYKVQDIGCGLVLHVFNDKNHDDITLPIHPNSLPCSTHPHAPPEEKCPVCPDKQLGILVTRVCGPCPNTICGDTTGTPPSGDEGSAASLIPVPAGYTAPSSP